MRGAALLVACLTAAASGCLHDHILGQLKEAEPHAARAARAMSEQGYAHGRHVDAQGRVLQASSEYQPLRIQVDFSKILGGG